MSNRRYITRHGKRIEIETLDFDPPAGKKNKRAEFVAVELDWVADMAETVGCPCATVLVVMRYLA